MQINIKMSDVIKIGAGLYCGWSLAKNTELLVNQIIQNIVDKKEKQDGAA